MNGDTLANNSTDSNYSDTFRISPLFTSVHRLLPEACIHGGAFWQAVGPEFDALDRHKEIVNADVLDAWFDPAPGVLNAVNEHLPWLLRSAPPSQSEGLIASLARTRNLPFPCLIAGAGSSALIYLAFSRWLTSAAKVLLPVPTYGEYAHVFENVVGCQIDRVQCLRSDSYALDTKSLLQTLQKTHYDLVVLVNPNNPTGQFMPREILETTLQDIPKNTRVWIDEAYGDYLGIDASVEQFAANSRNVFVCKSLSKGLALSGARAAYLTGPEAEIAKLRLHSPPWQIGLPAQVAAVAALQEQAYYAERYEETHTLRERLVYNLRRTLQSVDVLPGPANWVLCHLPLGGPDAATVTQFCANKNVFLRDLSALGMPLDNYSLRVAVKSERDNQRIVETLTQIL